MKTNSLTTLFPDMVSTINLKMRIMVSKGTIGEIKINGTMF